MEQNETLVYGRFDGCYGTVTGTCHFDAFLQLDNGEEALSSRVFCPDQRCFAPCCVRRWRDAKNSCPLMPSFAMPHDMHDKS